MFLIGSTSSCSPEFFVTPPTQGQNKQLTLIRLIMKNTIEQEIYERHRIALIEKAKEMDQDDEPNAAAAATTTTTTTSSSSSSSSSVSPMGTDVEGEQENGAGGKKDTPRQMQGNIEKKEKEEQKEQKEEEKKGAEKEEKRKSNQNT